MTNKIKNCWIIDDDPIFIYGTKRIMKGVNFSERIEVYNNGQDALEKLKAIIAAPSEIPNVILLDLNMPIMNGWDFLDSLKQLMQTYDMSDTQIYIISSSVDPRDIERVKNYKEVKNYILKPITPNDLEAILEKVMA